MKFSFFVLVISIGLLAFGSCISDSGVHEEDLVGDWTVVSAQKNGRKTELVIGASFDFSNEGQLKTNITGVDDIGLYSLEETLLMHHGISDVAYTLNKLTADSMQLTVELEGLNFILDLTR